MLEEHAQVADRLEQGLFGQGYSAVGDVTRRDSSVGDVIKACTAGFCKAHMDSSPAFPGLHDCE